MISGCFVSCNNAEHMNSNEDSGKYPFMDTVKIGLKSDSGKYELLTFYLKYTSKDTFTFEGGQKTKLGNENWQAINMSYVRP